MTSAVKDNQGRGKVGDFLKDGSRLSFVSAYFTIYAYEKLKDHLHKIDHLNFFFGDPRFVKSLDPDKTDKKAFKIENEKLALCPKKLRRNWTVYRANSTLNPFLADRFRYDVLSPPTFLVKREKSKLERSLDM